MYIVTGGAGMIGSAVIHMLNERGINDILVVDNLASTEKWKNLVNLQYSDYMHRTTFIEKIRSNSFRRNLHAIIHMGACSSTMELNADFLMENNFHFTRDTYLFAKEHGVRFINASSAATYGNGDNGFSDNIDCLHTLQPLNMYGYSKHLFDVWCMQNHHFEGVASLKFFNVYGPNEYHKGNMKSVVCKAVTQIKETGTLELFASDNPFYEHGGQQRDFIYLKDCAKLVGWLLDHRKINGILNVGTGKARSWNHLAHAVFNAMEVPHKIKYIPLPEVLRGKYQYFTQAQMAWPESTNYPFKFTSLEDGVKDYVQNYLLKDDPYLSSIKKV